MKSDKKKTIQRPRGLFGPYQVPFSDRVKLWERLAAKIDNKVNIAKAVLSSYRNQSDDGARSTSYSDLLQFWHHAMSGRVSGISSIRFGDLISQHVPPMERIFIRSGEESVDLEATDEAGVRSRFAQALRAAAAYATTVNGLVMTARSSWIMPFFFFLLDLVTVWLAGWQREMMMRTFEVRGLQFRGLVGLYVDFTDFFFNFGPFVVGGLVLAVFVLRFALPRWTGAVRRWADAHLPVFRSYRQYQGANVLAALAQMIGIDRTPTQAVGSILGHREMRHGVWEDRPSDQSSASPWLRMWLWPVFNRLRSNHPELAEALWFEGGRFPDKAICRDMREDSETDATAELAVKRLNAAAAGLAADIANTITRLAWASMIFSVSVSLLVFVGDWYVQDVLTKTVMAGR
jgi:hypothetical protein